MKVITLPLHAAASEKLPTCSCGCLESAIRFALARMYRNKRSHETFASRHGHGSISTNFDHVTTGNVTGIYCMGDVITDTVPRTFSFLVQSADLVTWIAFLRAVGELSREKIPAVNPITPSSWGRRPNPDRDHERDLIN